MPSSTNFAAGAETSAITLAYALQPDGAAFPSSGWNALRVTRETLGIQQQTSRPNEITGRRQVSPSVIQQVSASGEIGFNLSYGTFDDLFAAALGNDWTAALAIDGVAGDISTAASGNKLTSTTANKFSAIQVGQQIRLYGFAGANNGVYRVSAKTSNQDITLAGRLVTNETPAGTAAKVRGSMLRNGDQTQLVAFQKQLGVGQFLRYPAGMLGGFSLAGGVGQFFTGSFNTMARDETFSATSAGTVAAAPGGGFFNCVAAFGGVLLDDVAVDAVVQSLNLQVTREGASMVYGLGSDAAQGNIFGQVSLSGSMQVVWRNETLYQRARNGTLTQVSATLRDDAGNMYAITIPSAFLRNGSGQAGGPNQSVTSTLTIEGAQNAAGHCIQMDRFPAAP